MLNFKHGRKCIFENDFTGFKAMINHTNANYYDGGGHHKWTLLHHVANMYNNTHYNPLFITYLVQDCQAALNVQTSAGNTPLHFVVNSPGISAIHCIKTLLELGSNQHLRNKDGQTVIERRLALQFFENDPVIWLLLEYGAKISTGYVPKYVSRMINARRSARHTAVIIIGIRRYQRSSVNRYSKDHRKFCVD